MDWGNDSSFDILKPPQNHWANTSIWSGDIIKIKNGFLMFYTSRHREQDDGMTQNIGLAYSESYENLLENEWKVLGTRIQPNDPYLLKNLVGDITTHAWRDPFLFRENNQVYMLLSAKYKSTGDPIGRNGVVGLLKLKNNDFTQGDWQYLNPLLRPGCYSEMEVPQVYRDPWGEYELVFSSWAKYDFSSTTRKSGGLLGLTSPNLLNFDSESKGPMPDKYKFHVLMPEKYGLYACRIIPELDGEIVGFDIQEGGIRRSGVRTNFKHVNRDFSDLTFERRSRFFWLIVLLFFLGESSDITELPP